MSLGGFFSGIFGSKNKFQAQAPQIDRNNYNYGGTPGGADEAANRYRSTAEGAQDRGGVQVNYDQANQDRGMAMGARDLSLASRDDQREMAALMAARARGQVPSIAQMQADRQMQQGMAQQAAQAASARGAAGMALAQQNAANNTANMAGAISNQAQINAAQERMQAEQAAMGAYSNIRSGDMAMRGQDMQSQGMSAQQAQFQAQMEDAQRGRNDAMTMGMTQNEIAVRNAQMAGGMNYEGQRSANSMGAQGINAGVSGQNAGMNQANAWGAVGMMRDGAGAVGSLFKAHGGPVAQQQPYLVGEYGPELIVPAQDGHVIPAPQTREIVNRMYGGPVMGVDMGNSGGMTSDMVKQALTGRMSGGIAGMVGGGGITGGGGVPGGFQQRAAGGPVEGYAPSTWGQGGPAIPQQQAAAGGIANMNAAQNPPTYGPSGGLAVEGFTPGFATTNAAKVGALSRRDDELVLLARAKQAEGLELTPEEERRLGGAEFRQGQAKEAERTSAEKKKATDKAAAEKPKAEAQPKQKAFGTIDGMIAADRPEYRPMGTGYVPPQLLSPVARASGGEVDGVLPLYEPPGMELHQTADGHAFFAMAPGRQGSGSMGLASMAADPVVARVPVSKKAAQAPAKKQSEEEIRRAAALLEKQMRGEHEARMAAGPAVGIARMGR